MKKRNLILSKPEQVKKNKADGDAFAEKQTDEFKKEATDVVNEIPIKADDGTKSRVDSIGKDSNTDEVRIQKYKGSDTARLTENQEKAFPQIKSTGGTVVGEAKGAFPGGTRVPPTKIEIIRPLK